MAQQNKLSPRWTSDLLHRCTPKELVVLIAVYGLQEIAIRMGYSDVAKFVEEKKIPQ